MATWVAPIDSQTDPDAPLTSELGKRWDNNVIAAFEGAADAVRLHGDAVGTRLNGGLPVLTVNATPATYVPANSSLGITAGVNSTTSTTYVEAYRIEIDLYNGSMRFGASHRATSPANSFLGVFLNGSLQEEWSTSSTSEVARFRDISISPGDNVTWGIRTSSGASAAFFLNPGQAASDAYQEVAPLGLASKLVP